MFGFFIGTACLIGLLITLAKGRHGCASYRGGWAYGGPQYFGGGGGACGGGGCGPWAGRGWHAGPEGRGFGGPGGFGLGRFWLRGLFEHLDTTPGQEKVIAAAVEDVRKAAAEIRGEAGRTRSDVAKAVKGESFDETRMGETFARHDQAMDSMRKAVVGAMAQVHAVLDEKQRLRFAELIESGPYFGGFGGPYRRHGM